MRRLLIIYSLILFSSCDTTSRIEPDQQLELKIQKQILSDSKNLNIADLTDFEWDNLIILTPYSSYDDIEKALNIDLSPIKETGINRRDDINQIVFLKNEKIVKMTEQDRYPGDFSGNRIEFIKKTESSFVIITTDQVTSKGERLIEIKRK